MISKSVFYRIVVVFDEKGKYSRVKSNIDIKDEELYKLENR